MERQINREGTLRGGAPTKPDRESFSQRRKGREEEFCQENYGFVSKCESPSANQTRRILFFRQVFLCDLCVDLCGFARDFLGPVSLRLCRAGVPPASSAVDLPFKCLTRAVLMRIRDRICQRASLAFNYHGDSLTAAYAQCSQAPSDSAPLHLVQQRHKHSSPACSDRVT